MPHVLDDLDTRAGSATSLLRTVIGASLRAHGGWMATGTLVALMQRLDVPAERSRTALTRLKSKGVLEAHVDDRVPGYRLTPAALAMLGRGDGRIFHPRQMGPDERWCLISFSLPEHRRNLRHQLRRRLLWIGAGTVAPALWICPEHLLAEVHEIVAELGLAAEVSVFTAQPEQSTSRLRAAVERWWDLDTIAELHERFLRAHAEALACYEADPRPSLAFALWIKALDAWRPIPYLDPGLPDALLPENWPGSRSVPLFLEMRDRLGPAAAEFVGDVAGRAVVGGLASGPAR
jgi:phenylacetic acid degradation operon negative regulatory protein